MFQGRIRVADTAAATLETPTKARRPGHKLLANTASANHRPPKCTAIRSWIFFYSSRLIFGVQPPTDSRHKQMFAGWRIAAPHLATGPPTPHPSPGLDGRKFPRRGCRGAAEAARGAYLGALCRSGSRSSADPLTLTPHGAFPAPLCGGT